MSLVGPAITVAGQLIEPKPIMNWDEIGMGRNSWTPKMNDNEWFTQV
jgi:hypothetical protein